MEERIKESWEGNEGTAGHKVVLVQAEEEMQWGGSVEGETGFHRAGHAYSSRITRTSHRCVFHHSTLINIKHSCLKTQTFTFYPLLAFTQVALRAKLKVRGQSQGSSDSRRIWLRRVQGLYSVAADVTHLHSVAPKSHIHTCNYVKTSLMLNATIMAEGCG